MPTDIADIERLQADHYDRIAHDYGLHYGDKYSSQYRDRFINQKMFDGVDLAGLSVLEAMCGSGETTGYLLSRGAVVTGLDVSQSEIEKFSARWPGAHGKCSTIFETGFDDASFDCVVVVGGLHHLHPHLNRGVEEIWRILKPGGHFCFAEPHQDSIADIFRRKWYPHDDLFAENESAIDIRQLKADFAGRFRSVREFYGGNLGYLLVLNSMVFRIPLTVKRLYSTALLAIESILERFQGPRLSCMAVARWEKL